MTIVSHFIGNLKAWQDRTMALIMNLRCPTLTHYCWYHDTFMTLVFQRPDCNSDFWKERFISGLPPLFAEKIRDRLRNNDQGIIQYPLLTFSHIKNEIVHEGLSLCNDILLLSSI